MLPFYGKVYELKFMKGKIKQMTFWIIIGAFIALVLLKSILTHNISVEDAAEKLRAGAVLIDVRAPGEFSAKHIKQAINIPLSSISDVKDKVKDKKTPIILHCHSGARAVSACSTLRNMGYENVWNVGSYSRATKAANAAETQ